IYPPNPRLDFYWDVVARAYVVLEREMERCGSPHGYRVNYGTPAAVPGQSCGSSRLGYGSTRINIQPPNSIIAPRPALSPFSVAPALDPRSVRPQQLSVPPLPSVTVPRGFDDRLQRTPTATRQPISSRDGLRITLTGAMLQRLLKDR
ncbi:MAG: hypothetical protein AAFU85_13245, partial [Planctomycetota bacterium]